MAILVTGGAGFIGSNFVLDWLADSDEVVINLDKLTYAGNLQNLVSLEDNPRHIFIHGDIGDAMLVTALLTQHQPCAVVNFAAESDGVTSDKVIDQLIQNTPTAQDQLLQDARFQKLFAS